MEQHYQEIKHEPPQEHSQADPRGGFNSIETLVVENKSPTLPASNHHSLSPVAASATSPSSNGKAPPHPRPSHFLNKISPPLPPTRTSGNAVRRTLSGEYNVLPLPTARSLLTEPNTTPLRSFPFLRRCSNAPLANPAPPGNANLNSSIPVDVPPSASSPNLRTESLIPSPSQQGMNSSPRTSPYFPRHLLTRSVSDPNPILWSPTQETQKNSPVTFPRNHSTSPTPGTSCVTVTDDSPASKRLKTERMREMRRWFDEMIHEQEISSAGGGSDQGEFSTEMEVPGLSAAGYPTEEVELKDNGESNLAVVAAGEKGGCDGMINGGEEAGRSEEAEEKEEEDLVLAEKIGDRIHLNFKCRCGSGYEVLLVGENCYYKLL